MKEQGKELACLCVSFFNNPIGVQADSLAARLFYCHLKRDGDSDASHPVGWGIRMRCIHQEKVIFGTSVLVPHSIGKAV